MIVLLSGEKKNIGDFLITERARKLFAHLLDDEIIILDRFKNLESDIDLINSARFLVLCGGPAYASDIYKGIYPLVNDLRKIKVPIIPFGLGWCGRPSNPNEFRFNADSKMLLDNIHSTIENSSCRDDITASVLKNCGYNNVTMTGCPVWYDVESIGKEFEIKNSIKKIVFTTAADPKLIKQTYLLIKSINKYFPDAEITMSYHRGIFPDKHTTYRATIGYLLMYGVAKLVNRKIKIKDVAYKLEKLDFYDDCDFHIGYRVHAHLYFLSKRLPSMLINEDGRGKGMVQTMGLPIFNIEDKDVVAKVDRKLREYKDNNFDSFIEIGKYIDKQYNVMKGFIKHL
jgi:hypothetical protein